MFERQRRSPRRNNRNDVEMGSASSASLPVEPGAVYDGGRSSSPSPRAQPGQSNRSRGSLRRNQSSSTTALSTVSSRRPLIASESEADASGTSTNASDPTISSAEPSSLLPTQTLTSQQGAATLISRATSPPPYSFVEIAPGQITEGASRNLRRPSPLQTIPDPIGTSIRRIETPLPDYSSWIRTPDTASIMSRDGARR